MRTTQNRRAFLRNTSLLGASLLFLPKNLLAKGRSPNDKLNLGVIGVHNRGRANLEGVAGENIVALCDVDTTFLAAAAQKHPAARQYQDWRRMMDRKDLDAVVVSTPDHHHALATLAALRSGRHVYCEKPLTHTVAEARLVAETAARHKLATQMGTQIHASSNYRRTVELIQSGAIGTVRECHVWNEKGWTASQRPENRPPVPSTLDWDVWLGPVPKRPYHPDYHPRGWRAWWDFGGGNLGDMGCHLMDLVHWSLDLRHPTVIEAEGPPTLAEAAPAWLIVRYQYPSPQGPVKVTWYHGDKRPDLVTQEKVPDWQSAVLFVGDKGMVMANYGINKLLPAAQFAGFKRPEPSLPESIGHHAEWLQACKTGSPTTCHFGYGGALTEAVLLGNVAFRAGARLEWDPVSMTVKNHARANEFLHHEYRRGWRL